MYTTELQFLIEGVYRVVEIDRKQSFPFKIRYSDITNPTAIKTPYSTQISIPRTRVNDDIFSQIWRIDHHVFRFNPLVRTDFRLFVNNNIYQSGYVKLESVDKTSYKIRLFGGLGDYFNALGDLPLRELEFGELFTHKVNRFKVDESWNNQAFLNEDEQDISSFFGYAMTYQGEYDQFDNKYVVGSEGEDAREVTWGVGNKEYRSPTLNEHRRTDTVVENGQEITFFGEYRSYYQRPMVKFSTLFEKITETMRGKGWETDTDDPFFDEANPYWSKLWMICPPYAFEEENTLQVSVPDLSNDLIESESRGYNHKVELNLPQNVLTVDAGEEVDFKISLPFKFWTENVSGKLSKTLYKNNELQVWCEVLLTPTNGEKGISKRLSYQEGGNDSQIVFNRKLLMERKNGNNVNFYYQNKGDNDASLYTFFTHFVIEPRDRKMYYNMSLTLYFAGATSWSRDNNNNQRPYNLFPELQPYYIFYPKLSETSGNRSDAVKSYKDIINSETTALDFVLSYCKAFGLHFVKEDDRKVVKIMSRNSFFAKQERLDWTHKLDYSREQTLSPVPFTYQTGIFKWGELGTKYEEEYKSVNSKEYGSARFHTGYEFSDGVFNYLDGNIFNNCIIATEYSQYYLGRSNTLYKDNKALPHLQDSSSAKVDANFILVFKDGLSDRLDTPFIITDDTESMRALGFTWANTNHRLCYHYPKLLRTIRVGNGDYSLNFGSPSTVYNDDEVRVVKTDSTLSGGDTIYSRFWHHYLRDRFDKDNKVLTAYFHITLNDIKENLLDKFIYINDTIWVINEIYDFDPNSPAPTKVQLISVQDVQRYVNQKFIEGTMKIYAADGSPLYDSEDENSFPPINIPTDSKAQTIGLRVEASTGWSVEKDDLDAGVTVTPTTGAAKIPTDVNIYVPENETGSALYNSIPFRWGNSTTIVQILMVSNWRVTAIANAGTARINGLSSPRQIPDKTEVTFTVQDVPAGYTFAYWLIGYTYYYTQLATAQITDDTHARAYLYDTASQVMLTCTDEHTSILGEIPLNHFWLLDIGKEYIFSNTRANLSGYLFGSDEEFTVAAASVQKHITAAHTLLTVYYDTLLAHIHIDNKSLQPFSCSHLQLKYGETSVGNISGNIDAGTQTIIRYINANAQTGTYRMTATQQQKQYISIPDDTIHYQKAGEKDESGKDIPASTIQDFRIIVESIGWDNDGPITGVGAEENRTVRNTLYVPSGLRYEIVSSLGDVTINPQEGGSGTVLVGVTMGVNNTTSGRHSVITASIYNSNELVKECSFTIAQDAGRPVGWEIAEFTVGAQETVITNRLTIPSDSSYYLISSPSGAVSAQGQGNSSREITFTVNANPQIQRREITITANIYNTSSSDITYRSFVIYQAGLGD